MKLLTKPNLKFDRIGQLRFTLKEVFKLAFKINPKLLILVLVLNSIWGLTSVPAFYLEKLVLDKLVENIGNPDIKYAVYTIGFIAGLRLFLELFRNILSRVNRFLQRKLSRIFASEIEVILSEKLSVLDVETLEDPEFRDRFTKIEREAGSRAWGLMYPLSDIPNYLVSLITVVGVLFVLNPLLAVAVLLFSLPQFLFSAKFIKQEYELETKLAPDYRIWGFLTYYLVRNRNFLELKILDLSKYLAQKLRKIQKNAIGSQIALQKKREIANIWTYIPIFLLELCVTFWLIVLVLTTKITVGSFEFYLRSLRSTQTNLGGLVNSFLEIYENYIYVTDLVWLLNLKSKLSADTGKRVDLVNQDYSIKFDNVWFKYPRSSKSIIRNMNFEIRKGEKIALVGENGAGKSTLIKLLAKFYDPQKGYIEIGGVPLSEVDAKRYWNNFAILFQKFESYPFSARESIGYGDIDNIDDIEGIKDAARKTGIDEFIEGLPLKYDNPLAPEFDKGIDPSIGQWQRIGISRMLFRKNAKIVIMDEPTSNVDPEAEEKIFQELKKITKDKILIFVTQRFSTVKIADRIFVMHNGKIVEQGTHAELIKLDGRYARLFSLQAKAYTQN